MAEATIDVSARVGPADNALLPEAVGAALDALRASPPRVHVLVSSVAQPLLANIAAALSIDVSMTMDPQDVRPMVMASDVTLINLGMFDTARREGVMSAIATGCPFVLDPVKVDRAPDRMAFARTVLAAGPRIVKGNRAEMRALAPSTGSVSITTGPRDVIAHGPRQVTLTNGDPIMDRVIATGCAVGLLVTAVSAVERDPLVASIAGVALMSVAGEEAAQDCRGPGSFAVALIDAIAALDGESVAARMSLADD